MLNLLRLIACYKQVYKPSNVNESVAGVMIL